MGSLAETIRSGDFQSKLPRISQPPVLTLVETEKSFTPHKTTSLVVSRRILPKEITEKQINGLAALYRKGDYPLSEADAIKKARLELTDFDRIDVSGVPIFIPIAEPEAIPVFPALKQQVAREKPTPGLFPKPAMT